MEVKTILVLLVLNIALPTLDIGTDINLVCKLYGGVYGCERPSDYDSHRDLANYTKCYDDPITYCTNDENNHNFCRFFTHPKLATAMLTPFLLNYFVCFITFFRKEKNKKFTFIFPLLNIYPQFGMNNHEKINDWNIYF